MTWSFRVAALRVNTVPRHRPRCGVHVTVGERTRRALSDTIQPFPSLSRIYDAALKDLRLQVDAHAAPRRPDGRADGGYPKMVRWIGNDLTKAP